MKTICFFTRWMSASAAVAFFFTLIHSPLAKVLDDFNDNKVTGWEKFDFGSGNGFFEEEDGEFTIGMHQPTGQPFFVAATYAGEKFTIEDGVTLEFRVDLIGANQAEAYAAVGFIPSDTPVSKLSGYSLVKDSNDVLLAKGLNKFFYDITEGEWIDTPDNITLSITMTGRGNSVEITTRVFDIENNNALLFEKTVTDTAEADAFDTGDDSPAKSFIGKTGNFVLLLYHNDGSGVLPASSITLDNAKVFQYESAMIDDFDDNKVTGWEKFDFGSGNGFFEEVDGQFTIGMHQPPGQPFFVAATYGAKTFTIEDGVTVEFSADLIVANQAEAYLVVGFIPNDTPVSKLSGYSLAKDSNDVLLAKGLNKYFYDITEGEWIEYPDNIRLVLTMTGSGTSVDVTTKVMDLENNQAVLFEKTVTDTAEADVFDTGDDSPAASFIDRPGKYVLLLYHNDGSGSLPASSVTIDNAHASVSGASDKNQLPVISGVTPATNSPFLPTSTKITFVVSDDQAINPDGISITLNGTKYTTANGLAVVGADKAREVSLGGLQENVNYHAVLAAADSEGESDTRDLYFDTFSEDAFVIESEDYNFDYGEFIQNPVVISELDEDGEINWSESSYIAMEGGLLIDYFDNDVGLNPATHRYRPYDGVTTAPALDMARAKYTEAGGGTKGVYDFALYELEDGEWVNYTRNFPKGDYLVYLRQALFTLAESTATLELVTGDTAEEDQTTEPLGTFIGSESGVDFRNVPLTNEDGSEPVILKLSGKTTLRVTQRMTDPEDIYWKQNYLVFVKYVKPVKPALALQVSSAVNGPYKTDGGAAIDEANRTITLGQAGTTQFYRLSGSAVKIKSIQVANDKVTLKYE